MKTKIKQMPQGINSLVAGMNNNEFRLVPSTELGVLSGLFPEEQRAKLDSSVYGLSANCFFGISNRIDPTDDPNLINSEILVCDYDLATMTASVTGWLLNRGGSWHHNQPEELVTTSLTFDQAGLINQTLKLKGDDLGIIIKNCINDAYNKLQS
jgi:hypothetical protein